MDVPTHSILQTPLAEAHQAAGAKMGVWFGCALPDDFGDWRAEYQGARESVALIDKNYRAYIAFAGPDRVRYLNAILTNNIKDLALHHGTVSLLLNPQGHILAEIETYALQDQLFCVSYAMIREPLIGWLDKYIIMDDVTLMDETQRYATLAVEGPQAGTVVKELTEIDLGSLAELACVEAEIFSGRAGIYDRSANPSGAQEPRSAQDGTPQTGAVQPAIPCRIMKRSPGKVAGAEFVVAHEQLLELWRVLSEAVRKHGGGPMGYTALNALRLEQGIPWFSYDFGEKQIPHEAGLQNSHISYTKGCYIGQEIVERVRSRGHANRVRVALKFSGSDPPPAGTLLLVDGKETGYVTRAALSAALGTAIGMGYVRKEKSEIGTELEWTASRAAGEELQWTGGTAVVSEIPLVT